MDKARLIEVFEKINGELRFTAGTLGAHIVQVTKQPPGLGEFVRLSVSVVRRRADSFGYFVMLRTSAGVFTEPAPGRRYVDELILGNLFLSYCEPVGEVL